MKKRKLTESEKLEHCSGCRDNYYNSPATSTEGVCWMLKGFYLTPNPTYFDGFDGPKKTILAVEIDDSQILDVESVKDEDLLPIDPHFKMMSPMYKNTIIMKLALEKGYSGVKNGKEVVLFTDRAIRSIRPISSSHSK